MTWIQTVSGKAFDLLDPKQEQIDINDIAHALSQINRFAGHTPRPVSVAEHSCIVADAAEAYFLAIGFPPSDPLLLNGVWAALLHDAHEAYVGDVTAPVKRAFGSGWDVFERKVQTEVLRRFGAKRMEIAKECDMSALQAEQLAFFEPQARPWMLVETHIGCRAPEHLSPAHARLAFINRFNRWKRLRIENNLPVGEERP